MTKTTSSRAQITAMVYRMEITGSFLELFWRKRQLIIAPFLRTYIENRKCVYRVLSKRGGSRRACLQDASRQLSRAPKARAGKFEGFEERYSENFSQDDTRLRDPDIRNPYVNPNACASCAKSISKSVRIKPLLGFKDSKSISKIHKSTPPPPTV